MKELEFKKTTMKEYKLKSLPNIHAIQFDGLGITDEDRFVKHEKVRTVENYKGVVGLKIRASVVFYGIFEDSIAYAIVMDGGYGVLQININVGDYIHINEFGYFSVIARLEFENYYEVVK